MNERDKKQLIGVRDHWDFTHMTHAVYSGEIEVMSIHSIHGIHYNLT